MEYLSLSETELALACSRPGRPAQAYGAMQIGYFKAKQTFFRLTWDDAPDDRAFVLSRYFNGQVCEPTAVTKYERYAQRALIAALFDDRLWSAELLPPLAEHTAQSVRRDVTPGFIVAELIAYLNEQKIVRPGYTTVQTLISTALSTERQRLAALLAGALDGAAKDALAQLLVRDDTLSALAALKQDATDVGWRQMAQERDKRATLEPLYRIAKTLLPTRGVSQQNLHYDAGLANFYSVYALRRLKPAQTHLYLLCYAWQRYRQLTDNLVDAVGYHMKQCEDESKTRADKSLRAEKMRRQHDTPQVGRVLLLYVDETVDDATPFGAVRQRAFTILPQDELRIAGERLSAKPASKVALRWQAVDGLAARIRRHMRPLYGALDFSGGAPDHPWRAAHAWVKGVLAKQQRLAHRPWAECPAATVPLRMRPYVLTFDADGKATGVQADRYEFWLYRQLRKRLKSGDLYLDDSLQHRCFTDDLVSLDEKADVLGQLNIPWLRQPLDTQLAALTAERRTQWLAFKRELRQGKLTHLDDERETKTLTWRRPKADNTAAPQDNFYAQRPSCDVADVVRFVNDRCQFLSALTPLQPRYAKQVAHTESLTAVILAQAMN